MKAPKVSNTNYEKGRPRWLIVYNGSIANGNMVSHSICSYACTKQEQSDKFFNVPKQPGLRMIYVISLNADIAI
jgi:hypothetical protein